MPQEGLEPSRFPTWFWIKRVYQISPPGHILVPLYHPRGNHKVNVHWHLRFSMLSLKPPEEPLVRFLTDSSLVTVFPLRIVINGLLCRTCRNRTDHPEYHPRTTIDALRAHIQPRQVERCTQKWFHKDVSILRHLQAIELQVGISPTTSQ